MKKNNKWTKLADESVIKETVDALKKNNIEGLVVKNGKEAKKKVLDMLPEGAEVMNMTSVTLDTIGLSKEILQSNSHYSVRNQLMSLDPQKERKQMKILGAVHDYVIGSVQAVTQDGRVLIVSNTGSQIPAYAYGANHVIWVVGTQKIVKNLDEGFKRIYEYILPLESIRVQKVYKMPSSAVNKILIVNKEVLPGRITIVFVKEKLGF